jgi:endonuclease-3
LALIPIGALDKIAICSWGEVHVVATSVRAKTLGIVRTLKRKFPKTSVPTNGNLTDHLTAVVMSRGSGTTEAYRACARMMDAFVDWNEVRVARWGEIERILRPEIGSAESAEAARRLVYCLQQIFQHRGDVDLSGLARTSPAEARKFLLGLDCVDRDEANLVLLLGLGDPVMPVDSDVLRASKRMGVVSNSATKLQAQRALENVLEGEDLHACYLALREHARRICLTDSPSCTNCPVRGECRHPRRAH